MATSQATTKISWNAVDSDGVASSTLKIDGNTISNVGGPYAAASGVNFSASYGTLAAGSHSYIITATDKLGNVSTLNGKFTLTAAPTNAGPTIGSVAVSQAKGKISWNAVDSDGVASASITDRWLCGIGRRRPVRGCVRRELLGALRLRSAAGNHSYTITAVDKLGNVSTLNGSFTLSGPAANTGPTIGQVVVSQAKGKMSWNAVDSAGVASVALTVNGTAVAGIGGPWAATNGGANYSWSISSLSAGSHTYVITARDKTGNVSSLNGSFVITGAASSSASSSSESSAAKSLVLSNAGRSLVSSSAKVDWLYDFGGLLDATPLNVQR